MTHELLFMALERLLTMRYALNNDQRQQRRKPPLQSLAKLGKIPEGACAIATALQLRGSLIPPYVINAEGGGPHTKVEQAQWQY